MDIWLDKYMHLNNEMDMSNIEIYRETNIEAHLRSQWILQDKWFPI